MVLETTTISSTLRRGFKMTRSSNGNDTTHHGSRTTKDGIYDSDQTPSGYRAKPITYHCNASINA